MVTSACWAASKDNPQTRAESTSRIYAGSAELNDDPLQLSNYRRRYAQRQRPSPARDHDKDGSIGIIAAEHEPP